MFCSVIQYIQSKKLSVTGALELLGESLETLHSSSNSQPFSDKSFPNLSHLSPIPQTEQFPKPPLLQTHQQQLQCVSKEFNNQGLKVNRNFKCLFVLLSSKNNKKENKVCMKFSSNFMQRCLIPYLPPYPFKINISFHISMNLLELHLSP